MSVDDALSFTLDLIPGVGQIKSGLEFVTGKDIVTGEKLDPIERSFCALDFLPYGKFGKVGKKIKKGVLKANIVYKGINYGERKVK